MDKKQIEKATNIFATLKTEVCEKCNVSDCNKRDSDMNCRTMQEFDLGLLYLRNLLDEQEPYKTYTPTRLEIKAVEDILKAYKLQIPTVKIRGADIARAIIIMLRVGDFHEQEPVEVLADKTDEYPPILIKRLGDNIQVVVGGLPKPKSAEPVCEKCGGTGKVPNYNAPAYGHSLKPCPDCQPKPEKPITRIVCSPGALRPRKNPASKDNCAAFKSDSPSCSGCDSPSVADSCFRPPKPDEAKPEAAADPPRPNDESSFGDLWEYIDRLEAENKQLKTDLESGFMQGGYARLHCLQNKEDLYEQLKAALEKYGQHLPRCKYVKTQGIALCTCGLDKAKEQK
jgi:hypothetical protein